jgi:hypothetical protein
MHEGFPTIPMGILVWKEIVTADMLISLSAYFGFQ